MGRCLLESRFSKGWEKSKVQNNLRGVVWWTQGSTIKSTLTSRQEMEWHHPRAPFMGSHETLQLRVSISVVPSPRQWTAFKPLKSKFATAVANVWSYWAIIIARRRWSFVKRSKGIKEANIYIHLTSIKLKLFAVCSTIKITRALVNKAKKYARQFQFEFLVSALFWSGKRG